MNRFGKGFKHFFISSRKPEANGQDTNELQKRRKQRNQAKQEKPGVDVGPPAPNRPRSIFRTFSTSFKKDKHKERPGVPTPGEKPEKRSRDEIIQQLLHDIGRLSENTTRLKVEISAREAEVENAKNQGGGESTWKEGLYEQRMKEHANAQASINTGSASGEDILQLVGQLNEAIVGIATVATKNPTTDPRKDGPENIPKLLGERFPISFSNARNRLDIGLTQALLQIFLAQRCDALIHSWGLGNPQFDASFTEFYDRIHNREEQRVAGKWRQITLKQLSHTLDHQALQTEVMSTLIAISTCAGWKGNVEEISARVNLLIKSAEKIRKLVKEEIISADIRPWAAVSGAKFDPQEMEDVGVDFALHPVENPKQCTVLGCTGLGLNIQPPVEASSEMKNMRSKARVVLVQALDVGQPHASKL